MTNLRKITVFQKPVQLLFVQSGIGLRKNSEISQFITVNVGSVLLGEDVGINPISPPFGKDDAAVPVFVEALFENSAAKVITLPIPHRDNSFAQIIVRDPRLPSRFGEPRGFERAYQILTTTHDQDVALGAIKFKSCKVRGRIAYSVLSNQHEPFG